MERVNEQAINDTKQTDGLAIRLIEKIDIPNVLKLMTDIKPVIGGMSSESVYRALCEEALIDKRVVFIVAEEQSEIVAFSINIIDRKRWRFSFFVRHPLIAGANAFHRTFKKMIKAIKKASHSKKDIVSPMPDLDEYITPGTSDKSWSDSSPEIAKAIFTGVAESHRGKGFLKEIVAYGDKILASRGVRRVDKIILSHNIIMIRATVRMGLNIYRNKGGSLFITKYLKEDGSLLTDKDIE